jgi:hypothetical protein
VSLQKRTYTERHREAQRATEERDVSETGIETKTSHLLNVKPPLGGLGVKKVKVKVKVKVKRGNMLISRI